MDCWFGCGLNVMVWTGGLDWCELNGTEWTKCDMMVYTGVIVGTAGSM
jgi:hypothetical protein